MNWRKELLALLACLLLTAPAMGNSVLMQGGSSSMVESSSGSVSGGDFITIDASTENELGFTVGVRAYAELPEGVVGSAYSHWSKANNSSKVLSISNGDDFSLEANYSGLTNVDMNKTSVDGAAVSSAEVSARAHVDGKRLEGSAAISGMVSNTGIGETYSEAGGHADYDVRQTSSSSGLMPVKEAYGGVKGTISLKSINKGDAPIGEADGHTNITAASQADDISSSSSSTLDASLAAICLDNGGSTLVSGKTSGSSKAGAWDGSTSPRVQKAAGVNDNVLTQAGGVLIGESGAYSSGDLASLSSTLNSQARSSYDGYNFNEASDYVDMATSIKREEGDSDAVADVESSISSGYLSALSRDNQAAPSVNYSEAGIKSIHLESSMSAKNAWYGNNNLTSKLYALYDARPESKNELHLADISHQVINNGPSNNGDAADGSRMIEHITGQHAQAMNGQENSSAFIDDDELLSFINGATTTPGQNFVLGPISKPVFDASLHARHMWTGVSYKPLDTQVPNGNIVMYEARSSFDN